jgi:hypothetical protein
MTGTPAKLSPHALARALAGGLTVPEGFDVVAEARLRLVVRSEVRADVERLLRCWVTGALPTGRPLTGGRGGTRALDLSPGLSVVLRHCRRGGFPARFNRDLYFGMRPRPLRELAVTEELRRRGVPTPEVLGVAVLWVFPGCYRGVVVSREVTGALNLWSYLCSVDPPERERICREVAVVTIRMHDAGAVHPDLNLQNYLVRSDEQGTQVLIIDCDGVELRPVSPDDRRAAFQRICRSIRRLDPGGTVLSVADIEALRAIDKYPSA